MKTAVRRAICILFLALGAGAAPQPAPGAVIELVRLDAWTDLSDDKALFIDIDAGLWEVASIPVALNGLWDIKFSHSNENQTWVSASGSTSGGDVYQFACDTDSHQIEALGIGVGVHGEMPYTTFQTDGYLDKNVNWPASTHAFIGFRRVAGEDSYNYGFLEAEHGSVTVVGFGFQSSADTTATTEPIPIPEPALAGLACVGLLGLGARRRTLRFAR